MGAVISQTSSVSPAKTTSDVVDRIKELLPRFLASLPSAVNVQDSYRPHHYDSRFGQGCRIRLGADLVLVVIVIFFSSAKSARPRLFPAWRSLSIVGTFGDDVLVWLRPEQSLADGVTVSTGFVVDDAIVMIENITAIWT